MSLLQAQGMWLVVLAVAGVLSGGIIFCVIILARRASWEFRRYSAEIRLLVDEMNREVENAADIDGPIERNLGSNSWYRYLRHALKVDPRTAKDLIANARTSRAALKAIEASEDADPEERQRVVSTLRSNVGAQRDFNEARALLGLKKIRFPGQVPSPDIDPELSHS